MSIKKNSFKVAIVVSDIAFFVCELIWYFDFFANYGVTYDITTLIHPIPLEIAMAIVLISALMNKTKVALFVTGVFYAICFFWVNSKLY